jgi:peptidoglycan/xylan/chitin deacetylase (PgdA/CDA1 family)
VELNARKIQKITNRKPVYYRSATAASDEGCSQLAKLLGETVVSYSILSSDAVPQTPSEEIVKSIIKGLHPGGILIMHLNHPEWNGFEAWSAAVPQIRKQGYTFVKLRGHLLKDHTN